MEKLQNLHKDFQRAVPWIFDQERLPVGYNQLEDLIHPENLFPEDSNLSEQGPKGFDCSVHSLSQSVEHFLVNFDQFVLQVDDEDWLN